MSFDQFLLAHVSISVDARLCVQLKNLFLKIKHINFDTFVFSYSTSNNNSSNYWLICSGANVHKCYYLHFWSIFIELNQLVSLFQMEISVHVTYVGNV